MILSFLISNLFISSEIVDAAENRFVIEGEKAVDFTLKTVDGKVFNLSDYAGKIVIVNFWTTWCTYCQEEMEELIKFRKEANSLNVELLGVNVTSSEQSEKAVIHFVKGIDLPFQVGLDVHGEVSKTYQIIGIPTTFIIDKKGIVKKKLIGPVTSDMLKELITQ
ncbi:peroxiredoxin family protein [Metabacillus bambusae]|uniref:TlpA family protein disulfide reductase n=1 Tax=Metabacillus bambusae TaxID=2795218 RepID=A0ABS3N8M4_9BACI|nr:TlpA disulfide reductase family protein [Metabacillus bambusae]MBO1514490.1 TlpA family protein disulfide reductase [Metabacillus bambusae]